MTFTIRDETRLYLMSISNANERSNNATTTITRDVLRSATTVLLKKVTLISNGIEGFNSNTTTINIIGDVIRRLTTVVSNQVQ